MLFLLSLVACGSLGIPGDIDGDGVPFADGDCNDGDASVHPGATELLDQVDNNCDGERDDGTVAVDDDGDGYCEGDDNGVCSDGTLPGDCDDDLATSYPGATEVWYDSVDADCDGADDWDQDLDGYTLTDDCDDTSLLIHPGATEVWYDGVDQDCDGNDTDQDGDGYDSLDFGGDDCQDIESGIHPNAPEAWYDGVDQDCDGNDADQDGDGHAWTGSGGDDCDDEDALVSPDAAEVCDGIDNDCAAGADEATAEGANVWFGDADGDGYGSAVAMTTACEAPYGHVDRSDDCDDDNDQTHPGAAETCDGADNDCQGGADDGLTLETWYADADGDGFGDPATTTLWCEQPADYSDNDHDCDDAERTTNPDGTDVCDGVDNDCDGDEPDGCTNETAWISEESASSSVTCDSGLSAYGIECSGDYCDHVRLYCSSEGFPTLATSGSSWTAYASEEGGSVSCPANAVVTGIRCSGDYCDNISLECTPVSSTGGGATYTGTRVSDETTEETATDGYRLYGMGITGEYADNLTPWFVQYE